MIRAPVEWLFLVGSFWLCLVVPCHFVGGCFDQGTGTLHVVITIITT